jgi:hypothetical protein
MVVSIPDTPYNVGIYGCAYRLSNTFAKSIQKRISNTVVLHPKLTGRFPLPPSTHQFYTCIIKTKSRILLATLFSALYLIICWCACSVLPTSAAVCIRQVDGSFHKHYMPTSASEAVSKLNLRRNPLRHPSHFIKLLLVHHIYS